MTGKWMGIMKITSSLQPSRRMLLHLRLIRDGSDPNMFVCNFSLSGQKTCMHIFVCRWTKRLQ